MKVQNFFWIKYRTPKQNIFSCVDIETLDRQPLNWFTPGIWSWIISGYEKLFGNPQGPKHEPNCNFSNNKNFFSDLFMGWIWGMFTWPIQDDQMNMIKILNTTKKFTPTSINVWIFFWSCSNINVCRWELSVMFLPTLKFVGVKMFWSYSNQSLVILIGSCELASWIFIIAI